MYVIVNERVVHEAIKTKITYFCLACIVHTNACNVLYQPTFW